MIRPPARSFAAIARMIVPPGGYQLRMIWCITGTATFASRSQPGCLLTSIAGQSETSANSSTIERVCSWTS